MNRRPELVIESGRSERNYWADLWRYRELFQVLAWRDLAVRYKQTVIGALWAIIRPALGVAIFTVVFGRVAKLPSEGGAPYALMVLAGMLPWTFFSTAVSDASSSLIANSNLVSKVYFPRLIVPTATIAVALVDMCIGLGMLAVLSLWYGYAPGWQIVTLPVFMAMAFLATLGPALWISSVNVKYRDFRYVVPFLVQFGVYASPVGFSSSIVPDRWRLLYSLNPIVGVIDGFRWSILRGDTPVYWPGVGVGIALSVGLFWAGLRRFRRMEDSFADVI